ncbi:MAG: DegT/DnrJ/EryC1/StrS family aminotransferase [Aigarchaeota archaeon]|nr:DegT/DnrJ/EryC1/StrS family aminotransferase [Aigarchaeota archaeon]MDW8092583.1 DegT/DnrJ/EryC1/StrS family aminotransferase [Nitrososphaerota archaeon]
MVEGEVTRGENLRVPPWPIWDEEEERNLLSVLRSGKWGLGGSWVQKFEREFAAYHGCQYGIGCANGTVALKVALRAVGVKSGDEVITSPYTFVSTTSVIIELGAIPVFADINLETLTIEPSEVERRLSEKTRAILPVHIGGCPAEMEGLIEVSRGRDIRIVEDAAQAHGSEYRNRRVGGLGDAGCFSFQSNKLVTAGEGGVITTNDAETAALSRSLINCGRTPTEDWYESVVLGYNYRMSEFAAAVLSAQMKRLDDHMRRREESFRELSILCRGLDGFEWLEVPSYVTRHSHYFIPLTINRNHFGSIDKRRLVSEIVSRGIPCSTGYTVPLSRHRPIVEYLMSRDYAQQELTNVETACRDVIWFPHTILLLHPSEMYHVYRVLRDVSNNNT